MTTDRTATTTWWYWRCAMKKKYQFSELSKSEKEYHEMILMEEIDIQAWYAITYSKIFGEELILAVQ
jgi:hypothetical protein